MRYFKFFLLLELLFLNLSQNLQQNRKLQDDEEEEEYEEEEYEEYEEESDDFIPIKTYQRRSLNLGQKKKSTSKIFVYHIKPKKGLSSELIIDFYRRIYDDIDFYIYTNPDDIAYDAEKQVYLNALHEANLEGSDQYIVKDEDFLKSENDLYLVFSAPNVESSTNYIFVSLTNEVYDIEDLFRYTYYNNEKKTFYFYVPPKPEKYIYFQFQCLTAKPNSRIEIYSDEDYSKRKYSKDIKEEVYKNFFEIEQDQEYYISLNLELEDEEDENNGHYFDIAFTFHEYDKPIIFEYAFGESNEFPLVVPQDMYFAYDVERFQDDNILVRVPNLGDKEDKFEFAFYEADSFDDFLGDIKSSDFESVKKITSTEIYKFLLIPRNNKNQNYLIVKPFVDAVSFHDYDTVEMFYSIRLADDPITYGNFQTEKENYLYVKPEDFKNEEADVLVFTSSKPNNIEIIDFNSDSSEYYYLDYFTSYKNQFFFIEGKKLSNEIIVIFNYDYSFVEIRYRFIPNFELLEDNFPSSGRLYKIDDCSKNYFLIWPEHSFESEEDRTFIYHRVVQGQPEIEYGRIFDPNSDINSLFTAKYYDDVMMYDGNEEALIKITCEIPSTFHLFYFSSNNEIQMKSGNYVPVYLNALLSPRVGKQVSVIEYDTMNIELELVKEESIIAQHMKFEFNEHEYELTSDNTIKTFQISNFKDEDYINIYEIKGKMLSFIKMGLKKDDYIEINEPKTYNKNVPDKILIFPFKDLKYAQIFKISNPTDESLYLCIYTDYSNVYINPKETSCQFINKGENVNYTFYLYNIYTNINPVENEKFYTAIKLDEEAIFEYSIDKEYKEETSNNSHTVKGPHYSKRLTFYILMCVVLAFGLFIIFTVKKSDKGIDYLQFAEAAGFTEEINL